MLRPPVHRRGGYGLLAVVLVAGGCTQIVGPARTYRDYELKAASTAKSVLSAVATSRLTLRLGRDGDAFAPYLSVMASEAEDDGSAASSTFEGIQPPDHRADALRRRLEPLLADASRASSEVRIRARRTELGDPAPVLEARLASVARRLDRFSGAHG